MAVQPLSAADRAYVIQQATAIAQQQGITPEQALWNYAKQNNISATDLDAYMGWPDDTSLNWAVSTGNAPAPQGNFNPIGAPQAPATPTAPAPATPTTPAPTGINPTVAEWYRSVLGREPDAEGASFWTDVLNKNGPEAAKQSFTAAAQKELVAAGKIQPPGDRPPPPTWRDSFNAFNQKHIAEYGKEINRPWNEDADSRRAKQTIDEIYKASLQDYNTKYATDIPLDTSVLGPTAQPNTYTPDPKTGHNFLTKAATIAASVALAPATGGASLWAGPALLGVSEAAKTGDIGKGLLTAATTAAGAYGANSLLSGAGGANIVAPGTSGSYTLTGDLINDAANLKNLGYSNAAIDTMLGAGGAGTAMAIGTTVGSAGGGSGLLSTLQSGWNSLTGAANAAGGVTGSQLLATGANLIGGYLNQQAASDAAKTQADAQIRAAQIAADAAKFRPVGVKTNLGQSQFGYDAQGNLKTAGYTLDPRLQAQQNQLIGAAPGMLNNFTRSQQYLQPMIDAAGRAADIGRVQTNLGEGMLYQASQMRPDVNAIRSQTAQMGAAGQNAMTLGNQYLQTSPQQQAAKYLAEQQALLAPGRAQEMAALQAQMQAQGRGGLMVGGGVNGQMASNPQLNALYNARLQQDAQLAAQATQGGMDYAKFGAGLVDTGGGLMRNMYDTQTAAFKPYDTAQQLAMDQAKFGVGMSGTAGNMLRDVFATQTAAYAPYQQAMQGAQYLEGLGQNAMGLGIDIGAKGTAANAASGGLLATGMANAANTIGTQAQQAGSMWGNLLQGGARAFENYSKPAGTTYDPSKYRVVPL